MFVLPNSQAVEVAESANTSGADASAAADLADAGCDGAEGIAGDEAGIVLSPENATSVPFADQGAAAAVAAGTRDAARIWHADGNSFPMPDDDDGATELGNL